MRSRSALVVVSVASFAFFGCSSDDSSSVTPDAEASSDSSQDVAADGEATLPDGSGAEAARDSNAALDAGSEARVDSSLDGAADSTADAAHDAVADTSADASADARAEAGDGGVNPLAQRVLLISVDGLHQVDLAKFIAAHPDSTLAGLAKAGVQYSAAHTTTPSDSFPGVLALVTGGTPKSTGVYYDDSYDRTLYAPGSRCVGEGADAGTEAGAPGTPGTEIVFDESLEYDDSKLFSGGINPANLPLRKDANGNCVPVYPHDFIKVNTVFEVIREAGFHTAWSDKHAAYDLVNGPSGVGVDDLYTPEINSLIQNGGSANGVNLAATLAQCDGTTNSLPLAKVSDFTTCQPAVTAYDDVKVQAIINQIDGKFSDGSKSAPVPTILGMNFQQVSVAEKLPVGGYVDATGAPGPLLAAAIAHVDLSLGRMVTELTNKNLLSSTLIIISSKHGQAPIDKSTLSMESGGNGVFSSTVQDPLGTINAVDPAVENTPSAYTNPNSGSNYQIHGHFQTDDTGLLWLQDPSLTANIVTQLNLAGAAIFANALPTGTVFGSSINSGATLIALYGDPATNPIAAARAPNVVIQPNLGVIYSTSSKKIAEHGGGSPSDTSVALLVSLPSFSPGTTVMTPVATTQVAPTILRALGLDPAKLEAVQQENTGVLPNVF